MRRVLLLLPFVLPLAARAQPGAAFALPETDRLKRVARYNGWTVLRDVTAPADAPETAMVLARVFRPLDAALRPGHLAGMLRNIRVFRFDSLPLETRTQHAGLPAAAIQADGFSAQSRLPVVVRALVLFGPARSYLILASAPAADWPAFEDELGQVIGGFAPVAETASHVHR